MKTLITGTEEEYLSSLLAPILMQKEHQVIDVDVG
jgi:hypothetical protein